MGSTFVARCAGGEPRGKQCHRDDNGNRRDTLSTSRVRLWLVGFPLGKNCFWEQFGCRHRTDPQGIRGGKPWRLCIKI
jgi:hypothetical protein